MKRVVQIFACSMLFAGAMPVSADDVQSQQDNSGQNHEQAATNDKPAAKKQEDLESITVYGRMPEDSLKNIPQSVSLLDQELISSTPSLTVGDLIRFVPTASRDGSTLNSFGDDYLIRGFAASQTINGLGFNRVAHARDLANVERVEVLKGPASVLYGQMEPGAAINVVTKQPLDEFQARLGAEMGSDSHQRYTLDLTGPLADAVNGRLNLAYQDSGSFVDFWDLKRLFVAPNVSMKLSEATCVTLEGAYSRHEWGSFQNGRPASGAFLPNPHGQYSESFNPDEEDLGFTRRDSDYTNLRVEHNLNNEWTMRASYTNTRNDADFKEMFALGLREDMRTLNRAVFVGKNTWDKDHHVLLDLTGALTTGTLRHKLVAGVNYRDFDGARPTNFYLTTPIDLFEPVYGQADNLNPALRQYFQQNKALEGFMQDRMILSEQLQLLVGLRYTDSEQDSEFINLAGESSLDNLNETNWSSQFGLLYQFKPDWSVYANRSESFVPQAGNASGGRPFDAQTGTQYEVGSRLAIGDSGLSANAALFTITKDNLLTTDPANPGFEAALGEVRSRGLELSVSGYLTSDWFVGLAYGFTKTEIVQNFDGLQGNRLRNTPQHTLALQSRYQLTQQLEGFATLESVDSRFGDDDNSFKMPGHTRLDLGAIYQLNAQLSVSLMLNNATDQHIYAEGYSDARVIREPGRTVLARLDWRYE